MAVHDAHRAWLKLTTPSRGLSKTKKRSVLHEALLTATGSDPNSSTASASSPDNLEVQGSSKTVVVDVKGLEPLTSRV